MISGPVRIDARPTPQWPAPEFRVRAVRDLSGMIAPTLGFEVCVEDRSSRPIQMIALHCDIRIDPARRNFTRVEHARLADILGAPGSVSSASQLAWARTDVIVPGFTSNMTFTLQVPCTFDLEIATARYLQALDGGNASLQFLFSGSVFYVDDAERLQLVPIGRGREARFELPAPSWQRMMSRHHPDGTWLHVQPRTLERLRAARTAGGSWSDEAALIELLDAAGVANIDAAGVANIEAVGVANLEAVGIANIEAAGVARLDAADIASIDTARVAHLDAAGVARLDATGSARTER